MRFSLILATLGLSTFALAQRGAQDGPTQVGYAANLNIGDSVVNLANTGSTGPFGLPAVPPTQGNICVNAYVVDPQEEEIGCCACLVTPFGLNSLSVRNDLISNNLTPAVPNSVSIYLISSFPGTDPTTGSLTICNPANQNLNTLFGLAAWGSTFAPAASPGTYAPITVPFKTVTDDDAETDIYRNSANSSRQTVLATVSAGPAVWALSVARSIKHNGEEIRQTPI